MYFSANPGTNTILLNAWTGEAGGRVKLSITVKSYEQPGRAMEVLRLSRSRHMPFESVMARLSGKETMTGREIENFIVSNRERSTK